VNVQGIEFMQWYGIVVVIILALLFFRERLQRIFNQLRDATRKKVPVRTVVVGGERTRRGHHESRGNITSHSEERVKTTGDILKEVTHYKMGLKRRGTGRIEPVTHLPPKYVVKKCNRKDRTLAKWDLVIKRLENHGSVFFSRNEHYGDLRGIHIARCARKDLKRIGYETRIVFKGRDCILELT